MTYFIQYISTFLAIVSWIKIIFFNINFQLKNFKNDSSK